MSKLNIATHNINFKQKNNNNWHVMKGQQDLKMEESKRLINVAYFLKANFKTKFYVN